MRSLPFAGETFAAVLSLFTAFGYFGGPSENLDPLRETARVLFPGGHWFLDYFDADRVKAELLSVDSLVRSRELGPLEIREEKRFLADRSVVAKEVFLRPRRGSLEEAARLGVPPEGMRYTEEVAVFSLAELDAMASGEGLNRVGAAGGYEGQPLGRGDRWILVYEKSQKT
jgi:hypothetical protein